MSDIKDAVEGALAGLRPYQIQMIGRALRPMKLEPGKKYKIRILDAPQFGRAYKTNYGIYKAARIDLGEDDPRLARAKAAIQRPEDSEIFAALIKAANERGNKVDYTAYVDPAAKSEPHKCNCSMQQLLREGCKCGGI